MFCTVSWANLDPKQNSDQTNGRITGQLYISPGFGADTPPLVIILTLTWAFTQPLNLTQGRKSTCTKNFKVMLWLYQRWLDGSPSNECRDVIRSIPDDLRPSLNLTQPLNLTQGRKSTGTKNFKVMLWLYQRWLDGSPSDECRDVVRSIPDEQAVQLRLERVVERQPRVTWGRRRLYREVTAWKVRPYGFYSRLVVKYHKTNERGFASKYWVYFLKQWVNRNCAKWSSVCLYTREIYHSPSR